MARPTLPEHVARTIVACGGVAIVSSMFLPWLDRGNGSAASLRAVADLAISGRLGERWPAWVGLVVYLLPLAGAVAIFGTGVRRGGRTITSISVGVAGIMTVVALVLTIQRDRAPGPGQWLAIVGFAMALGGVLGRPRV